MIPTLVATSAAPMKTTTERVLADGRGQRRPADERQHDSEDAHERGGAADVPEVVQPRLEPDPEQQEHGAELREHLDGLPDLDPAEQGGPHEDSGQDLADDGRLVDPLEELVADLRGQQDQEEVEDRLGDARRRRGEDH